MAYLTVFVLITAMIGCGAEQEPPPPPPEPTATPFGAIEEVEKYMQAIDPYIRQVSDIQSKMYEVVGTSNVATGQNLAQFIVDTEAIEGLQTSIESFNGIVPPALLAPLHRDIEKMLVLRLEGFKLTLQGREAEATKSPGDQYTQATGKLEEANAITIGLNDRLKEVNQAVHSIREQQQASSSP